jgi:hypothetical protein
MSFQVIYFSRGGRFNKISDAITYSLGVGAEAKKFAELLKK